MAVAGRALPRLTLFSKAANCSLCDTAKEVLKRAQPEIPHILDVVDITEPSNKKWFDLYRYEIPVLHYEGREIMRHRIDLERLRAAVHPKESP